MCGGIPGERKDYTNIILYRNNHVSTFNGFLAVKYTKILHSISLQTNFDSTRDKVEPNYVASQEYGVRTLWHQMYCLRHLIRQKFIDEEEHEIFKWKEQ